MYKLCQQPQPTNQPAPLDCSSPSPRSLPSGASRKRRRRTMRISVIKLSSNQFADCSWWRRRLTSYSIVSLPDEIPPLGLSKLYRGCGRKMRGTGWTGTGTGIKCETVSMGPQVDLAPPVELPIIPLTGIHSMMMDRLNAMNQNPRSLPSNFPSIINIRTKRVSP